MLPAHALLVLPLPQKDSEGAIHLAQVRGQPPLFLVYDVAMRVPAAAETRQAKAPAPLDSAVKAAFAQTREEAAGKPETPVKKK